MLKLTSSLLISTLFMALVAAQPIAVQMDPQNISALQKRGPDAIGGLGDWHLSNGTICAIVSDPKHEHEFSHRGGALVDLGFCNRPDDHFAFTQDLLDGSRNKPLNGQSIRAEATDDSASIIVTLTAAGVEMQTRYQVDVNAPTQLAISKRLRITNPEVANFNLISLGSFNYHSLEPFVLASQQVEHSAGFSNVDFVTRGSSAIMEAAHNADTLITVSPPDAIAPITYGWRLLSAESVEGEDRTTLPRFALADEESMALLVLADDFWLGDGSSIGWLQLPQIPLLSMSQDAELQLEEVIYVGASASVSSVTDQIFSDSASVNGTARPGTALHLLNNNGGGVIHHRVGSSSNFSFKAPPGDYTLRHLGSGGRQASRQLSHGRNESEVGQLKLAPISTLQLPRGQAMRLVFQGINGTEDPDFANSLTDFSVTGDDDFNRPKPVSQVFLAGVDSDQQMVEIAAGEYLVYATRGLEYSVESTQLAVQVGDKLTLEIEPPKRLINTPGRIAADFHVHAGSSFDNTFSNQERVRTFVAEAGEVMVNTEHDVVVDFAPLVTSLGVDDKITALTGAEVTSLLLSEELPNTGGHINFFPYQPQPDEYRMGMVANEGRRLRDVMHEVKLKNPGSIAQLNHPRRNLSLSNGAPDNFADLIDNGAYLDHMGVAAFPYNPNQSLQSAPNNTLIDKDPLTGARDLDFDAMEIVNPGGEFHTERIEAVRRDWLSFLLQGEHITGTANSDSHHSNEQVAVPRNMVSVSNDHVNDFSRAEFLAAIKTGNLYGTSGPMIELDLGGVGMGQTFSGDQAKLNLRIFAADWIPIERATIEVNGQVVEELSIDSDQTLSIPLKFEQDAILTVQVYGQANTIYAALYPGIEPYAFTNPIYVDADGDNEWTPPGLNNNEQ